MTASKLSVIAKCVLYSSAFHHFCLIPGHPKEEDHALVLGIEGRAIVVPVPDLGIGAVILLEHGPRKGEKEREKEREEGKVFPQSNLKLLVVSSTFVFPNSNRKYDQKMFLVFTFHFKYGSDLMNCSLEYNRQIDE